MYVVLVTDTSYIYSVMLHFHMITFAIAGTIVTSSDNCAHARYFIACYGALLYANMVYAVG